MFVVQEDERQRDKQFETMKDDDIEGRTTLKPNSFAKFPPKNCIIQKISLKQFK